MRGSMRRTIKTIRWRVSYLIGILIVYPSQNDWGFIFDTMTIVMKLRSFRHEVRRPFGILRWRLWYLCGVQKKFGTRADWEYHLYKRTRRAVQ